MEVSGKENHQQCGKPLNTMERPKLRSQGRTKDQKESYVERALKSCKEEKCTIASFNDLVAPEATTSIASVRSAHADNHRLESRMREIRQSGSEGGEAGLTSFPYPYLC